MARTEEKAVSARRILLCVSGLSPQIITETLYALAQEDMAQLPTEVHVITTETGAQRVELSLLSKDLNWFERLRNDYQLPPIAFDTSNIHIIANAAGQCLDDIRTEKDNQIAADFITNKVRELSSDPQASLHVSIAGGRKTMGFYLGYALSLYGRPHDRLSHVLVSEPFESSWDFFYPTPYRNVLQTRDKGLHDTATAQVTLANIPFVPLRHGLPQELLLGQSSFNDTVSAAKRSLLPPKLKLFRKQHIVNAAGMDVHLAPKEMAFYMLFANAGMDVWAIPAKASKDPQKIVKGDANLIERYLDIYTQVNEGVDIDWTMTGDTFSELKSRVNKKLKTVLGPTTAVLYQIHEKPKNGLKQRMFGLSLNPQDLQEPTESEIDERLATPAKRKRHI